jgi:hypothetical protein
MKENVWLKCKKHYQKMTYKCKTKKYFLNRSIILVILKTKPYSMYVLNFEFFILRQIRTESFNLNIQHKSEFWFEFQNLNHIIKYAKWIYNKKIYSPAYHFGAIISSDNDTSIHISCCPILERTQLLFDHGGQERRIFLLENLQNISYLQRQCMSKFIFTNGLIKSVSWTHAFKTLFFLSARCPNKRKNKMTQRTWVELTLFKFTYHIYIIFFIFGVFER